MKLSKRARFPLGHDITLDELDRDPYPVFARLRQREPISWLPALNMWYIVGYEDVRTALFDSTRLTTASPQSTIFATFGAPILTTEGATHDRYRQGTKQPFAPNFTLSRELATFCDTVRPELFLRTNTVGGSRGQ
jgi:cytochrome P450